MSKTAFEEMTERVLFGQPMMLMIHPDNVSDQLRFEAESLGYEVKEVRACQHDKAYILDVGRLYAECVA